MFDDIFLIKKINGINSYVSVGSLGLIMSSSGSLQLSKDSVTTTSNTFNPVPGIRKFTAITGENSMVLGGNTDLARYTGINGNFTSSLFGDINAAGPDSLTIVGSSLVSGLGSVAIGGRFGLAVNGGILMNSIHSRTKDFGVVLGMFNNNSGENSFILGGYNLISLKSKNNLILGGQRNSISDAGGIYDLRNDQSQPQSTALCTLNSNSINATFPKNSIIAGGERNMITSGDSNLILGGIQNCIQINGVGKSVGNVVLNGYNHSLQNSNFSVAMGNAAFMGNTSYTMRNGTSYPGVKIDGSTALTRINIGCNSSASTSTVSIGGCFNFQMGGNSEGSVVLGGGENRYNSPILIFGLQNCTRFSSSNLNILFGRNNDILESTVSGVTSFSDSVGLEKHFNQIDSNSLRLSFTNGVYIKSPSGILLNQNGNKTMYNKIADIKTLDRNNSNLIDGFFTAVV